MDTLTQNQAEHQALRNIRRALRLRRWQVALMAAREFHELSGQRNWYSPTGQIEYGEMRYMRVAEQSGILCERARELWLWMRLHLEPGLGARLTQERWDHALEQARDPMNAMRRFTIIRDAEAAPPITAQPAPPVEPRPLIRVTAGDLTGQVDAAEKALIAAGVGLYQRSGSLVRLGWVEDGATEALRVVPVDEMHLLELIGRVTDWTRYDARTKADVPASCPRDVAKAYISRGGLDWRVPHLTGVIGNATLRANGELLEAPGHDPETGLFLDDAECPAWCLHEPTLADAQDAAETLDELLAEFPFVGPADEAVAVAAILTAVVRRSLPAAPLFAFTAPTPGTGKSLLVDLIATIATGAPASGFSWSDDQHENRKQLDAALLESRAAINLDNVTAPLGGDRLNQVLTQATASVRVLGQSKTVEVPCGAFITANGNNLAIAADLTRRTMLCSLDAKMERPEQRHFRADPLAMVQADRAKYVSAALTILRAYHVAGRPDVCDPLGSFDAWSGWVRSAVVWLDYADPANSQDAVRAIDPRGAELAAVLGQWDVVLGDRRVTSAQIIEAASAGNVEFREALLAVAGASGAVNTVRLGKWLHANKGRLIGGLRIKDAGKAKGGYSTWQLSGGMPYADVLAFTGREFMEAVQ